MKEYRAIKKGFDGVKIREVGDIFPYDGPVGSWMQEIGKEYKDSQVKEAPKKPESKKSKDVI